MEGRLSAAPRLKVAVVAAVAALGVLAVAPAAQAAGTHHKRHHRYAHLKRHHRYAHLKRHHRRHHAATSAHAQAASSPAPTPAAPCTDVDSPAGTAPVSALDAAVVCLINQQRSSRGLPALTDNSKLDSSAQSWTGWMVSNGQFTHGTNFAGRISAAGYDWQTAGENIATGYATPNQVVAAWMASPDHCRNILDPNFRDVGTGVMDAPVSGFATGPATWTQDFGLGMYAVAPSSNTGPQNGCPYGG